MNYERYYKECKRHGISPMSKQAYLSALQTADTNRLPREDDSWSVEDWALFIMLIMPSENIGINTSENDMTHDHHQEEHRDTESISNDSQDSGGDNGCSSDD